MPKRGAGRGNYAIAFGGGGNGGGGSGSRFSALKDYHEHDDRERGNDRDRDNDRNKDRRRVSFKPSGLVQRRWMDGGDPEKRKWMELAIRNRLEDDEVMGDFASSSKFHERDSKPMRKGSPIPKGKFCNFRKLIASPFGWYQVTIQCGNRYSKNDLLNALYGAMLPDTFEPQYWRLERNCAVFFTDDYKIAERLQMIDRSIQMGDGYRLLIRVRGGCPITPIDESFKEKMKLVMANRYNPSTRALDMSRFHLDLGFKNIFCGLFRTPVMSAALDIIVKNIPELVALNLADNAISSMESFKNVGGRLPNLRILYLDDNKIGSLAHLLVLRPVPITELRLKGNPLRQRYKEHALYVSEVRRKFPKLTKLDGMELEPQIMFDLNETTALPKAKASYLCDTSGAAIIRQFLEQYFIIFDSNNRQPLLDAYHEQAMMSVTVPPAHQAGRLYSFWKYNRNFRRIMLNDESFKKRQLKFGRLSVVSTLAKWPKTIHDRQSFTVDLTLFTPKLMSFTVTGLFKEFEADDVTLSNGDVRYFQRQYVVVPAGGGFCIRNELILVTSATSAQVRSFLTERSAATSTSTVGVTATAISPATHGVLQNRLQLNQTSTMTAQLLQQQQQQEISRPQTTVLDEATQLQMIQAMSAQSNMNTEWSKKCLEETNWDYNHAAFVFDKLQKEHKIPPEAFIK